MGTPWVMLKAFLLELQLGFQQKAFLLGSRGVGPVVKGKSG